jgi:hypothetical protein
MERRIKDHKEKKVENINMEKKGGATRKANILVISYVRQGAKETREHGKREREQLQKNPSQVAVRFDGVRKEAAGRRSNKSSPLRVSHNPLPWLWVCVVLSTGIIFWVSSVYMYMTQIISASSSPAASVPARPSSSWHPRSCTCP